MNKQQINKVKIFFITVILIFGCAAFLKGQIYSERDVEICNAKFSFAAAKNLAEKPVGEVIVEIGKSFIGTDYEASALEKDGEEQLVINLTGLDCTTFLESVLAFSRLIKEGKTTFEDYRKELTGIRYRGGVIDKYPSRLHYFSDWIFDNKKKGIIEDITKEIGGEPVKFNLSFMSDNPEYYKQLKDNPEFIQEIKKQEKKISCRKYFYIPKNNVYSAEGRINNGDLIAFTTSREGLDIGHVGIAVKMETGRIHLLHAPVPGSKVQITENPLPSYINNLKNDTGIIVLRVKDY